MRKVLLRLTSIFLSLCFAFYGMAIDASAAPLQSKALDPIGKENSAYDIPVILFNNTAVSIYAVYITESSSDSWGDNVLGSFVLNPGEYYDTTIDISSGELEWDFKIEDCEGTALYNYEIYIGDMPSSGFGVEWVWDEDGIFLNLAAEEDDLYGVYLTENA